MPRPSTVASHIASGLHALRRPLTAQPQRTSGQGAPDSQPTTGSVRDTDETTPLDAVVRQWGNLPPRKRERVLQGAKEPVLPDYRDLVEQYYKAVAEEAREGP